MEPAFASIRKANRDRLKVYCYSAAGGFTTHRIPNIVSSELAEEGLLRDVLTRKALANGKTMEDLMAEVSQLRGVELLIFNYLAPDLLRRQRDRQDGSRTSSHV